MNCCCFWIYLAIYSNLALLARVDLYLSMQAMHFWHYGVHGFYDFMMLTIFTMLRIYDFTIPMMLMMRTIYMSYNLMMLMELAHLMAYMPLPGCSHLRCGQS